MVDTNEPAEVLGASDAMPSAPQEEPQLKNVDVVAECRTGEGDFVGLSGTQMRALGIARGDTVYITTLDPGDGTERFLGLRTVCMIMKEHAGEGRITANGAMGQRLNIRKAPDVMQQPVRVATQFDIEKRPPHTERHGKRVDVIGGRFPGADGESYVVIPTPLGAMMGFPPTADNPTHRQHSRGKLKMPGWTEPHDVTFVMQGSVMGFTSAARTELNRHGDFGNPRELSLIVRNGVLEAEEVQTEAVRTGE